MYVLSHDNVEVEMSQCILGTKKETYCSKSKDKTRWGNEINIDRERWNKEKKKKEKLCERVCRVDTATLIAASNDSKGEQ